MGNLQDIISIVYYVFNSKITLNPNWMSVSGDCIILHLSLCFLRVFMLKHAFLYVLYILDKIPLKKMDTSNYIYSEYVSTSIFGSACPRYCP